MLNGAVNRLDVRVLAAAMLEVGSWSEREDFPPRRWGSDPPFRKLRRKRRNFRWESELRLAIPAISEKCQKWWSKKPRIRHMGPLPRLPSIFNPDL
jgi:hypothetical protein